MNDINLQDWVGKTEEATDRLYPTTVKAMAATLDATELNTTPGAPLPEVWHWLYFLPLVARSRIDVDGHPQRGGFLPPVALERRMWASGQLTFHQDLHIDEAITKRSEILKVSEKEGKTGKMVFVTVRHTLHSERGLAVEEEQNIVYLPMPTRYTPPPPAPAPADLAWTEGFALDPVLLFRFSALTFNAHRIHYDIQYASEVEKYPGLVVHGPLQAMVLLQAAKRQHPGRQPAHYQYRAVRPLFVFDKAVIGGKPNAEGGHELCMINTDGHMTMQATVAWRPL